MRSNAPRSTKVKTAARWIAFITLAGVFWRVGSPSEGDETGGGKNIDADERVAGGRILVALTCLLFTATLPLAALGWWAYQEGSTDQPMPPLLGDLCLLTDRVGVSIDVHSSLSIDDFYPVDAPLKISLRVGWPQGSEPPLVVVQDGSGAGLVWTEETTALLGVNDVGPVRVTTDEAAARTAVLLIADLSRFPHTQTAGTSHAQLSLQAGGQGAIGLSTAGPRAAVRLPRITAGSVSEFMRCGFPGRLSDAPANAYNATAAPRVATTASIQFDPRVWFVTSSAPQPAEQSFQLYWDSYVQTSTGPPASYQANLEKNGGAARERFLIFVSAATIGIGGSALIGALQMLPGAVAHLRQRRSRAGDERTAC